MKTHRFERDSFQARIALFKERPLENQPSAILKFFSRCSPRLISERLFSFKDGINL